MEELRTFFRLYDPLHKREQEIFGRLAYIDVQHLTSRIRAEVLMATDLKDPLCLPCTQFAAFNRIRSTKRALLYRDAGHETPQGFWDKAFEFLVDW